LTRVSDPAEPISREEIRALPEAAEPSTASRPILAEADRVGADAIVMGSRGLTRLKSLLLGSVSHEVLQHANRPVVFVPLTDGGRGPLARGAGGGRPASCGTALS
jgi:nucleotide-binding universal stress UspA family protein